MPELNRRQFEQPEFPGMPAPTLGPQRGDYRPMDPHDPANPNMVEPYGSAHSRGDWESNPLAPGAADRGFGVTSTTGRGFERSEEFVPSWRIVSSQKRVSREAIDHMKENANPLALKNDPEFWAREGTKDSPENIRSALAKSHGDRYTSIMDEPEIYDVTDGNHRVNAALERGQLLIPGKVARL